MKSTIFAAALTLATSFGLVLPAVACGPSNNTAVRAVCPTNNPYPYSPYGSNPYPYGSTCFPRDCSCRDVHGTDRPPHRVAVDQPRRKHDVSRFHPERDERHHSRDFRYGKVGRIEENAEDRRDQNRRCH